MIWKWNKSKPSLFQDLKCWVGLYEKAFKATVSVDEARFIFPVGKKDQWEWNVKGAGFPVNATRDYSLAVYVGQMPHSNKMPPAESFGWVHRVDGLQQSGTLSQLLAAGTVSSIRRQYVGPRASGGNMQITEDFLAGVSVQLKCGNVVLLISGKENVQNVFSSRPEKVRFVTSQPGNPDVDEKVSVIYDN